MIFTRMVYKGVFLLFALSLLTLSLRAQEAPGGSLFITLFDESGSLGEKGIAKIKQFLPELERGVYNNNFYMFHRFGEKNVRERFPKPYQSEIFSKVFTNLNYSSNITRLHDALYSASIYGEEEGEINDLFPFIVLFTDGYNEGGEIDQETMLMALRQKNVPILAFPIEGKKGINEEFFRLIANESGGAVFRDPGPGVAEFINSINKNKQKNFEEGRFGGGTGEGYKEREGSGEFEIISEGSGEDNSDDNELKDSALSSQGENFNSGLSDLGSKDFSGGSGFASSSSANGSESATSSTSTSSSSSHSSGSENEYYLPWWLWLILLLLILLILFLLFLYLSLRYGGSRDLSKGEFTNSSGSDFNSESSGMYGTDYYGHKNNPESEDILDPAKLETIRGTKPYFQDLEDKATDDFLTKIIKARLRQIKRVKEPIESEAKDWLKSFKNR